MYYSYKDYNKIKEDKSGKDTGLTKEGTWGKSASGILIITEDKKEILLLLRSKVCTDPLLWGIPGGARMEIKGELEDPLIRAVTETREELGMLPKGKIRVNPYIFNLPNSNFTYYTYILEISLEEKEKFKPKLNWEHNEWKWFKISEAENEAKLHQGVKDLLIHYSF